MSAQKPELADPVVHGYVADLASRRKIIFVTGCARSGTSLLQRCMSTVSEPVYFWSENPLSKLYHERNNLSDGRHYVLKRTSGCHEHFANIPPQVRILHIVRDPGAVFTSTVRQRPGYYVSPERWKTEYEAFQGLERRHPQANLHVVRYEDLMSDPDETQRSIATNLDVSFDLLFTQYVERNPLDKKIDKFTGKLRVWEAIDSTRGQLKRNSAEIESRMRAIHPGISTYLDEFCTQFRYKMYGVRQV